MCPALLALYKSPCFISKSRNKFHYEIIKLNDPGKKVQFKNYNGYTAGLFDVNEGNNIFSWAHKSENPGFLISNFDKLLSKLNPEPNEILVLKNNLAYNVIDRIYKAVNGKQFIFIRIQRDLQAIIESVVKGL